MYFELILKSLLEIEVWKFGNQFKNWASEKFRSSTLELEFPMFILSF
jgi:hypothetical protein